MRIAQVAPLYESVPARAHGGTQRVVSYLTEALVGMGHEVTLFASGDSITSAHLVSPIPRSLRLDPHKPDPLVWHTILMDMVLKSAHSFDVIHFHTDVLQLALVGQCRTPCVSTAHGRLDLPDLKALFRCFPRHAMVSVSGCQRLALPGANWRATVHHGLPENLYVPKYEAQNYFAFLGRICADKRVERAIAIARSCDVQLRIAGRIDPHDLPYFDAHIKPLIDNAQVTFEGEIAQDAKNDFLGNARALLVPLDTAEPSSLVLIEAMACATPVIAFANGCVPEIIDPGLTGFMVDTLEQAIAAASGVDRIDRTRCRQVFEQRFTDRVMAQRYLDVYDDLTQDRFTDLRLAA